MWECLLKQFTGPANTFVFFFWFSSNSSFFFFGLFVEWQGLLNLLRKLRRRDGQVSFVVYSGAFAWSPFFFFKCAALAGNRIAERL